MELEIEVAPEVRKRIADEAARLGVTVDLLVNEVLRQALERDGHDVGPPLLDLPLAQIPSTAPDGDRQQERWSEA